MKKHYIKTIEDLKYCEENNFVIRDADCKSNSYTFEGNCWVYYLKGQPALYNASIRLTSKLYYEEPEQEATTDDIGKLCWFYTDDDDNVKDIRDIGILTGMPYKEGDSRHYKMDNIYYYKHCRRLSPAEVAEITGYGVTEDGSTFYGEPFKIVGKEK